MLPSKPSTFGIPWPGGRKAVIDKLDPDQHPALSKAKAGVWSHPPVPMAGSIMDGCRPVRAISIVVMPAIVFFGSNKNVRTRDRNDVSDSLVRRVNVGPK